MSPPTTRSRSRAALEGESNAEGRDSSFTTENLQSNAAPTPVGQVEVLPSDRHCTAVPPQDHVNDGSSSRHLHATDTDRGHMLQDQRQTLDSAKLSLTQSLRPHGLNLYDPPEWADVQGQNLCLMQA